MGRLGVVPTPAPNTRTERQCRLLLIAFSW